MRESHLPVYDLADLATASGGPAPTGPRLKVSASWPADGSVGLLTDPVVVRFNQPVDGATVTAASFRVVQGTAVVPGTAEAGYDAAGEPDARTVVWRPATPLAPASAWRLVVSRDVRSRGGRELEDPFVAVFTTHGLKPPGVPAGLDPGQRLVRAPNLGPPPRVRFTFPQAGLGNVYTDEVIIRFNRTMDEGAFSSGTFTVQQDGKSLPGTVSFPADGSGREVLFTPDRPLFRDTTFQMVVTRDARTLRGRYLREEYRAGFGTSPFKGGVKPVLPEDFDDLTAPSLPVGRAFHTVTALPGGDLIVVGGQDLAGSPLASCYRWNASSGTFTSIASLGTARRKHAAVPSREGGVMVIGGFGPTGATLSSTEVYDPVADTWTPAASMTASRASHTATVVAGSRILVAGGFTNGGGFLNYAQGAEVFNPFTPGWSATAGAPVALRGGHTATLLPDGRVLLAGGASALALVNEVYQPASGTFAATSPPGEYRIFHAACLTKSGSVLLAGGGPGRAERYDPSLDSYREAGFCPPFQLPVSTSPDYATLTLIPGGGRIALIGGLVYEGGGPGIDLVLDQVQIWDPAGNAGEGAFYPMLFDLMVPRAAHTVNPMPDGGFLIIGGFGTDGLENERSVTIFRPSQ